HATRSRGGSALPSAWAFRDVDAPQPLVAGAQRSERAERCFLGTLVCRRPKQLRLIVRAQNGEELVQITLHHRIKRMEGKLHAMIRHAILWIVVGADLFRAIAASDHGAALVADGVGTLALGDLEKLCAEYLHRASKVLTLWALFFCEDDQAGRDVLEVGRAHGGVDALSAGTSSRRLGDLEIFIVDLNIDLVGLGEDGDGRGRSMDASAALGHGDALDAMHSRLEAKPAIDLIACDDGDHFFEAAGRCIALRSDFNLPPLALGVARIHTEKIGRKERRLLASGASADLEKDVLFVVRILGKQEEVDRLFKLFDPRFKLGKLFLGELTQLGVGERLLILADLLLRLEEFVISLDELVQVRALAAQLRETLPIGRDLG